MFNPAMRYGVEIGVSHLLPSDRELILDCGNQRFDARRSGESFSSTKEYYESIFKHYLALDVNNNMGAEVVDLNYLHPRFGNIANMVCNSGTSEHLFNQAAFFENMHNWCISNGVMVHFLPFTPWLNHGFFNYNPIFFRDLAAANNYIVLLARICDRNMMGYCDLLPLHFKEKRPTELINEVERIMNLTGREVMLLYMFKKTHQFSFKYPFQGKYIKDIDSVELKEQYG